jgi:CRISPR/Cas system-associated protein Cas10 (large subunit of type III CRISPR-Cas system)
MSKYLYGAAVQGIQSFIFQTNKLREIVGASELVEQICTSFFRNQVGEINFKEENLILGAAGNIKYIFDDEKSCQALVRKFPKAVMEFAPGITISQAVVKMEGEGKLKDALDELEKLLKTQRSKPSIPLETGFMGVTKSRRTGGLAFKANQSPNEDEIICEATDKKIDASNTNDTNSQKVDSLFHKISGISNYSILDLPLNIEDITEKEGNSWIAVIHADGNGLGTILQNIGNSLGDFTDAQIQAVFKQFSKSIEDATRAAAQTAFKNVVKDKSSKTHKYPIRPIILGGDDLTVIIRADLALAFTYEFLKAFETETKIKFAFLNNDYKITGFEKGITAAAGIAYVKASYPFHYAVHLSEKLCKEAKNFVRDANNVPWKTQLIPESSFSFFKVQDSFIEDDLKQIRERTLQASVISFAYGPYLIKPKNDQPNYDDLNNKLDILKKYAEGNDSKGVSKLRQWITVLYKDPNEANFMIERLKTINEDFSKDLELDKHTTAGKSIIYDLIQLHTLQY